MWFVSKRRDTIFRLLSGFILQARQPSLLVLQSASCLGSGYPLYPVIAGLHEAAKARGGFIVDGRFLAVADAMEQVRDGSECWQGWRDLHEQKKLALVR